MSFNISKVISKLAYHFEIENPQDIKYDIKKKERNEKFRYFFS